MAASFSRREVNPPRDYLVREAPYGRVIVYRRVTASIIDDPIGSTTWTLQLTRARDVIKRYEPGEWLGMDVVDEVVA